MGWFDAKLPLVTEEDDEDDETGKYDSKPSIFNRLSVRQLEADDSDDEADGVDSITDANVVLNDSSKSRELNEAEEESMRRKFEEEALVDNYF